MLPDFPRSKAEVLRAITRRISSLEKQQHSFLAQVKTFRQYEGDTIDFEQVDFGRETQSAEEHAVRVDIRLDEVPTLTGEKLEGKLKLLANRFGALKMSSLFAKVDKAIEQTGFRLDAEGRPIDGRMLLDMINMVEEKFDKAGKPTGTIVVHPDMMPSLIRATEEVENDPELKRRLASIQSRQYEQWTNREDRRKLVD